jgi:hypothetical protein
MRTALILLAIFANHCCFSQAAKISYEDAIKSIGEDKWEVYKVEGNDSCSFGFGDSVLFDVAMANRDFLQKVCNCKTKRKASYGRSESWATMKMIDPITEDTVSRRIMDGIFDIFLIDSATSHNSFGMVTLGNDGYYTGTIHFSSVREFVITRQYQCIDNVPFQQRIYFRRIKR